MLWLRMPSSPFFGVFLLRQLHLQRESETAPWLEWELLLPAHQDSIEQYVGFFFANAVLAIFHSLSLVCAF